MRVVVSLLAALALVPSAAACSFFANPDGGLDVRIHSIRSGQFGFAGDVEYTVYVGDAAGTSYSWDGPFTGGATPDPFIHTYDSAGSYELTLQCHYLDDGTVDTYTEFVTVGGLLGLAWWVWLTIAVGVVGVAVAGRMNQKKRQE